MMKQVIVRTATVCMTLGLVACGPGGLTNQEGGALLGAGLGALAGSQIGSGSGQVAAAIAGSWIGASLGSRVGASMDAEARRRADAAAYDAFASGRNVHWRSRQAYGVVRPYGTYRDRYNRICRRFSTRVWIEGEGMSTASGIACLHRGRWRIVA